MKFKKLFVFLFLICITCCSAFAENKFVKVVLVGDRYFGKTCVWKRMLGEGFDPDEKWSDRLTSRDLIRTDNGDILCITLWDTAGTDRYYDEVVDFTRDANFVFIVHDLYKRRDGNVETYLSRIYRDIHEKAPRAKILLVGSKYDCRHRDIANTSKQAELVEMVAKHIPCDFVYTSALEDNNPGIATLLNYIVQESRNMVLPTHSSPSVIRFNADIVPPPAPAKSGCTLL